MKTIKHTLQSVLLSDFFGNILRNIFSQRIPFHHARLNVSSASIRGKVIALLFFKKYEKEEIHLIKKYMRRDLPVIDLGASIGAVSSNVAKLSNQPIVCVEASPMLAGIIRENLLENKIPEEQFTIVNSAIADKKDTGTTLHFAPRGSNELGKLCDTPTEDYIQVNAISLSSLLEKHISKDFVLISDIEGAEAAFLTDATEKLEGCAQLFIELHPVTWKGIFYSIEDLKACILKKGFTEVCSSGVNYHYIRIEKSKVVHVALGKANPNRANGVNKVVYHLAESQKKNGHDSAVWGITRTPSAYFPPRVFSTRLFKDLTSKFWISRALKKAIDKEPKSTVFHLHGAFLPQLSAVSRRLRKNGLDYIFTPHGSYNSVALKRSSFKKNIYSFLFERHMVHNAKLIQAIGASEVEGTRKAFGNSLPIQLIPNGQTIAPIVSTSARKEEGIHFGFIGRLDIHTKGLDLLLQGFSDFVAQYGVSCRLHIIGGGSQLKEVVDLIQQLSISEQVTLHGEVFGDAKKQRMQTFDYLCLTSRNEGLPGVVLEALAEGIPCIVSKETNMGTFISTYNAGYSLEHTTIHTIKNVFLLATENLSERTYIWQKKNAVKLIENEFNWSSISKQLIHSFYAQ